MKQRNICSPNNFFLNITIFIILKILVRCIAILLCIYDDTSTLRSDIEKTNMISLHGRVSNPITLNNIAKNHT